METLPLVLTITSIILGVFAFIFWFAHKATKNNHRQLQLLATHFRLQIQPTKSFWQMPVLTGYLDSFPIKIQAILNVQSEGNELIVNLTIPPQAFEFNLFRKTKLGKKKSDVEFLDERIDNHYHISTKQPQLVKAFLQNQSIKKALAAFKDNFMAGTTIRLAEGQITYYMALAAVGDKKRQNLIQTIETMGLLANHLA